MNEINNTINELSNVYLRTENKLVLKHIIDKNISLEALPTPEYYGVKYELSMNDNFIAMINNEYHNILYNDAKHSIHYKHVTWKNIGTSTNHSFIAPGGMKIFPTYDSVVVMTGTFVKRESIRVYTINYSTCELEHKPIFTERLNAFCRQVPTGKILSCQYPTQERPVGYLTLLKGGYPLGTVFASFTGSEAEDYTFSTDCVTHEKKLLEIHRLDNNYIIFDNTPSLTTRMIYIAKKLETYEEDGLWHYSYDYLKDDKVFEEIIGIGKECVYLYNFKSNQVRVLSVGGGYGAPRREYSTL